jgi:glycosyltransferase involved in cell wall biosynthesis
MATADLKKTKIGFIHNAFPVLSETFISKEMRGLKALGMDLEVYSLFHPKRGRLDANYSEASDVHYVLDSLKLWTIIFHHFYFLISSPVRYFSTFIFALRHRQTKQCVFKTLIDFARKKDANKEQRQDILVHFFLAAPLARMMKADNVSFINSHFADAAASFAMLSAKLLGLRFGVTAHAYDIFTPQFNLSEKISQAKFLLTCTQYNFESLIEQHSSINGENIHVFYHGIDTDKFERKNQQNNATPELLTVGRLTAKKGFDVLLKACAELRNQGVAFKCRIIGDGEEKDELINLAAELDLNDIVEFVGVISSTEIKNFYERADLFVLPCIIDNDGNRDGIPNVIAEAMAMELPVVSSKISGIPELVEQNETGFLLDQQDIFGVAGSIKSLIINHELSRKMGENGRNRVLSIFDSRVCLENLYTFYMNELSNGD